MLVMSVLGIAEARRKLPQLVRRVAAGQPPVSIGRRGRPEVVLVAAPLAVQVIRRRRLAGLVEVVGGGRELDEAHRDILRDVEASLERAASRLPPTTRRR